MSNLVEAAKSWKGLATPFYAYNLTLLKKTLKACADAANEHNFHVHYALKANTRPQIIAQMVQHGFGADCVSGNEVLFALEQGFEPQKIVFAGVGKSDREIKDALRANISCFNCESLEEMLIIQELAAQLNTQAHIALRINPNVNAYTHHYITTGLDENKFGINRQQLPQLVDQLKLCPNLVLKGLHFHIGSQICDLEVFKNLCTRVNEFVSWFESHQFTVEMINVGGGLGVDYLHPDQNSIPDFKAYFEVFNRFLNRGKHQSVHFELGRSLVAQCGDLISRVLYVKEGLKTKFVILDAGMTELLRPALYQARHHISQLNARSNEMETYDVVGPVCESSDCFAKAIELPLVQRGDLLAIRSAGAYGEVMANNYNLRKAEEAVFY